MKKKIVGLVVAASLGLMAASAGAASWHTFEFTYAGVTCNAFGAPGIGANGGAYLANWNSTAPVLINCPFMHDATFNEVANTVRLDFNGNVIGCVVVAQARNGTGSWWYPTQTAAGPGGTYTESTWTQQMFTPYDTIAGTSIQCSLGKGSNLEQYRVNSYFQQDPGQ